MVDMIAAIGAASTNPARKGGTAARIVIGIA